MKPRLYTTEPLISVPSCAPTIFLFFSLSISFYLFIYVSRITIRYYTTIAQRRRTGRNGETTLRSQRRGRLCIYIAADRRDRRRSSFVLTTKDTSFVTHRAPDIGTGHLALALSACISFARDYHPLGTYAARTHVSAFPFRRVTTRDVTIPPYVSYFRAALNEPCRPARMPETSLPSKQVEQTPPLFYT